MSLGGINIQYKYRENGIQPVNGIQLDVWQNEIPVEISSDELGEIIDRAIGTDQVLVWNDEWSYRDGRTFYIHFRGVNNQDIPEIVANNNNLAGGSSKP